MKEKEKSRKICHCRQVQEHKRQDKKSLGHQQVGVLNCHKQTDTQTKWHCNSMPVQWADSVKIVETWSMEYIYAITNEDFFIQ